MAVTATTRCAQQALISVDVDEFQPTEGKYYSVGIHPWHVGDDWQEKVERLKQVAQHYLVVAIGETGLDSLKGAPLDLQQQVMQEVINIAAATGKPLIIHCVRGRRMSLRRMSRQIQMVWLL